MAVIQPSSSCYVILCLNICLWILIILFIIRVLLSGFCHVKTLSARQISFSCCQTLSISNTCQANLLNSYYTFMNQTKILQSLSPSNHQYYFLFVVSIQRTTLYSSPHQLNYTIDFHKTGVLARQTPLTLIYKYQTNPNLPPSTMLTQLLLFLLLLLLPLVFSSPLSFTIKLHHRSKSPAAAIASVVVPNTADHLTQFSIGTPPINIHAIIDTGSDLVWSRCDPCIDCLGRDVPAFDPNLSSTYSFLRCNSTLCKDLNPSACSEGKTCNYTYGYGDGSFTLGVLSAETLTFGTTDSGSVSIPSIAFGCGHNNSISFDGHQIGLVGRGGGRTSLISQLGPYIDRKFSYCLVPFLDNSSFSIMNFGHNAIIYDKNSVSTPLVQKQDNTYYYVTLESIAVGDTKVEALITSTGTGNMFIDSGTTVTLLNTGVFDELADVITAIVGLARTMDEGNTFVCYNATSREGFPEITLGFAGGAYLVMRPENAFTAPSAEGLVCLAMQATEGTAVLGNLAQQNFHVGFDLVKGKVSFAPAECSELLS